MTDNSYWIAFGIDTANSYADLGEYKDNDLHITLAYLGKEEDQRDTLFAVRAWSLLNKLVHYFPDGFVTYGQKMDIWHKSYLILSDLFIPTTVRSMRQTLVDNLFISDVWYSTKYVWNPHITLTKLNGDENYDLNDARIIKRNIPINSLFFHTPEKRHHWNL